MAGYPLTWLADVLRDAGCTVIEEGNWRHHGRDGSFAPKAIMLHHDASPAGETSNGADVIINGRPGLEGPLSQLWLDYDGRWHVIAAGRASHAGEGGPWGVIAHDQGNRDAIGIETDHTTDEKWTDPQRSEALRGVHALCQKLGITTPEEIDRAVTAHKEYAPDRKVDPDPMDMDAARAKLAAYDDQGDGPVDTLHKSTTTDRSIPAGGWTDLRFGEDNDPTGTFAIKQGPVTWFNATIQTYVDGPAGTIVTLRPYRTFDGHNDQYLWAMRTFEIPASGHLYAEVAQQSKLPEDWWLRVQATASSPCTATAAYAQVATW